MAWTSFTLNHGSLSPFEEVPCPRCGAFLVIHAPDPHDSERMLGVCGDCHAWFLMHCAEGKLMKLPDPPDAVGRRTGRKGTGSSRT